MKQYNVGVGLIIKAENEEEAINIAGKEIAKAIEESENITHLFAVTIQE